MKNRQPTHIAVAFDTDAPTARHAAYAEYKATRQAMPEDLSLAIPHVYRMLEAFRIPVLTCDGYEADDIIGTLAWQAEKQGFTTHMVSPDKDFGQLIDENDCLYRPSRMGDGVEILGVQEIKQRWGIERPAQVIDVLALMGDSVDNVPGVPGVGEKTAMKLIGQFGTVENLLARTSELTGKLKERVESNREAALLSKKLVTINCESPCSVDLESLTVQSPDEDKLKAILIEFEFNSIGKRLFGEDFKAGRGFQPVLPARGNTLAPPGPKLRPPKQAVPEGTVAQDFVLEGETEGGSVEATPAPILANLKTVADVPHEYKTLTTANERAELVRQLLSKDSFCSNLETTSLDPKEARIVGMAFSFEPHKGHYVAMPKEPAEVQRVLEEFRPAFESERIEKVNHNLKFDISVLKANGIEMRGNMFDTM